MKPGHKNSKRLSVPHQEQWPALRLLNRPADNKQSLSHLLIASFQGLIRGYALGTVSLGGIHFVSTLTREKAFIAAFNQFFSKQVRRFSTFVGLTIGTFRLLNAIFSKYFTDGSLKSSKTSTFVAALIAAQAIALETRSRAQTITLFLFIRAVDLVVRRSARLKHLPTFPHSEKLLFGVCNVPIMYGFIYQPEILQKAYYKWILKMGAVTDQGLNLAGREVRNARLNGVILPFRSCQPHYHTEGCLHHVSVDWFKGLGRASWIYIPVHLLPILLFRLSKIKSLVELQSISKEYLLNVLKSCLFLTTYVFIIKSNICFWRNLLQADYAFAGMLAGLFTGFACFFERKSRISELSLFCWPKALEATWKFLVWKKLVKNVQFKWYVPVFAWSCAVLATSARRDYKKTYFGFVELVIGQVE